MNDELVSYTVVTVLFVTSLFVCPCLVSFNSGLSCFICASLSAVLAYNWPFALVKPFNKVKLFNHFHFHFHCLLHLSDVTSNIRHHQRMRIVDHGSPTRGLPCCVMRPAAIFVNFMYIGIYIYICMYTHTHVYIYKGKGKGKGKGTVHPRTGHEGPDRE